MDLARSPSIEFCMSLQDIIAQLHCSVFNVKLNIPREGGIVFYAYIFVYPCQVCYLRRICFLPFFDLQRQHFECSGQLTSNIHCEIEFK